MRYLVVFINSFLVGFSGAASPGPLLTLTINESYRKGFWVGPQIIIGHSILELALLVSILSGLDRFLALDPVIGSISFFGSVFLLFLGFQIIRDFNKEHLAFSVKNKKEVKMSPIVSGVLVSLSNPYWTLWWVTIGLALVLDSLVVKTIGAVIFFIGHILSDFVWYSFVSYSVSKGKDFISEKYFRYVLLGCGVFLIYLAVFFFITGINRFNISF